MTKPASLRTRPGRRGGIVLFQRVLPAGSWVALTRGGLWLGMPLTPQHLVTA